MLRQENFNDWLAGFTDGDGCFHFRRDKKGSWEFSFSITQSTYNLCILYFIKSQLSIGYVNSHNGLVARFHVRDQRQLLEHVVPIFEKHSLLTKKYWQYECFKQALTISQDPKFSKKKRFFNVED